MSAPDVRQVERLLVVMPSWVGDVVMATPALRALRSLYPGAKMTLLMKSMPRPLVDGSPWHDRIIEMRRTTDKIPALSSSARRRSFAAMANRLKSHAFDLAVLLPNSFRAALLTRLAQIPRRVGYDRDGRGFLLTDRLLPIREGGRFVPMSTLHYYLGIARYLGADSPDPRMELFTRPQDDAQVRTMLQAAGAAENRPLVMLNPGANYGDAKMWYPDRFAAVGDGLAEQFGATILVNGSPRERRIVDQVLAAAKHRFVDLQAMGGNLTLLKSFVKQCAVMVTNDTGPRHIAAAFGVPVVTIFGPTDPRWSEIHFAMERQVRVDVFCGPCQKKICPLDHRCMTQVSADQVLGEAKALLSPQPRLYTP